MRLSGLLVPILLSISAACLCPSAGFSQERGGIAGDTPGVLRLLAGAKAGGVIRLRPGVYDHVVINGFHGDATLTSLEPGRPAVLTDLTIKNSSGLTLKSLDFDNTNFPPNASNPGGTSAFLIVNSDNILLSKLDVHGSPSGSLATDVSGFSINSSRHVTVEHSDFHNLHTALHHGNDEWLTVRDNHFHHLRDDGFSGGGSSNVLVENNHCDSNHPDGAADTDHPDCIQFWTAGTKAPAHDITIVGNTYDRGDGTPTQGIWMRDEVGTLPFQHVTVTGNVIRGAMYNGISVYGATDVKISGNTVCQYRDQPSWIVVRVIDGVEVTGNASSRLAYVKSTRIRDSGNKHVDDCRPAPHDH